MAVNNEGDLRRERVMTTYEFTLFFALPEGAGSPAEFVDALYEAGCDDAVVGVGNPRLIALEFSRDAATASEAVQSAIRGALEAIPEARLIEVKPDFVSLSDIAELAGCSRQNMRKYATGQIRGVKQPFPAPVYTGSPSLWHLHDVVRWIPSTGDLRIHPAIAEVSALAYDINIKILGSRAESDQAVSIVQSTSPRRVRPESLREQLRFHKKCFRALPESRVLTSAERQFEPMYAGAGRE